MAIKVQEVEDVEPLSSAPRVARTGSLVWMLLLVLTTLSSVLLTRSQATRDDREAPFASAPAVTPAPLNVPAAAVVPPVAAAAWVTPPARQALMLPQLRQIWRGDSAYRLHSAMLLSDAADRRALLVRVQLSNHGAEDRLLSAAAVALRLGDQVLLAASPLSETVPARQTRQIELRFELPPGAQRGELLMGELGDQAAGVPIDW